mgnify:CR=1 FL=1
MEPYIALDKTVVVSFCEVRLSPELYLVLGSGFTKSENPRVSGRVI